jgi:hypothetical protein
MATAAANVPAESDLLCEACGYVLNGLPQSSNCPECGVAADESDPSRRGAPAWERRPSLGTFFTTTYEVLFHPHRFYRGLATRAGRGASRVFGMVHLVMASSLFGLAGLVHVIGFIYYGPFGAFQSTAIIFNSRPLGFLTFTTATLLMLGITVPIAARLTSWEARYRGYRLPLRVVLRGLDYHTAHYLPVAAMAALTVAGYRWYAGSTRLNLIGDAGYIYIVCGEVIVGAAYLFWTYWIGMRNMMYANR